MTDDEIWRKIFGIFLQDEKDGKEIAKRTFDFLSGVVYAYKLETIKNDFATFTFNSRWQKGE